MRKCFVIYEVIYRSGTVITLTLLAKSCLPVLYFKLQNPFVFTLVLIDIVVIVF